jgi:hypothetical protein
MKPSISIACVKREFLDADRSHDLQQESGPEAAPREERRWALAELAADRLTIDAIRGAAPTTCTLPERAGGPPPPDIRAPDPALLAILCRRGLMALLLSILPEGVGDLISLGWLTPPNAQTLMPWRCACEPRRCSARRWLAARTIEDSTRHLTAAVPA